jgi:hypothetical protein
VFELASTIPYEDPAAQHVDVNKVIVRLARALGMPDEIGQEAGI